MGTLFALLFSAACASPSAPTAPTVPPAQTLADIWLSYTINVPDLDVYEADVQQYPNGVKMAPAKAQIQFDYLAFYGGTPNVYWGETAPPAGTYSFAGIVVAPRIFAESEDITQGSWQGCPGTAPAQCHWIGTFAFTR